MALQRQPPGSPRPAASLCVWLPQPAPGRCEAFTVPVLPPSGDSPRARCSPRPCLYTPSGRPRDTRVRTSLSEGQSGWRRPQLALGASRWHCVWQTFYPGSLSTPVGQMTVDCKLERACVTGRLSSGRCGLAKETSEQRTRSTPIPRLPAVGCRPSHRLAAGREGDDRPRPRRVLYL